MTTTKFNPVTEQEMQDSWVAVQLAKIDANEDTIYANIGAYDPEAFASYRANEQHRLTEIAQRTISAEDPESVMWFHQGWR